MDAASVAGSDDLSTMTEEDYQGEGESVQVG